MRNKNYFEVEINLRTKKSEILCNCNILTSFSNFLSSIFIFGFEFFY